MSESETGEDWLPEPGAPSESEGESWPLRGLMLAVLGLATGLGVHFLIGDIFRHAPSAMTLAKVAALSVTAGMIGFTIRRRGWAASLIFSLICGAVAGAVLYWNGDPTGWSGGDGWRAFALIIALGIAAPLFQAALDAGGVRFPYVRVHDHVWANIVLWGACWAFVGITLALSWLLAALFQLIKIDFLNDLLMKNWFWRSLVGLAFGAALGVLRDHANVVRLLQRVAALVLSVLAPVLAVGLVIFLLALPFTGLAPLWEAGSAASILLGCTVGSMILVNVVIGSAAEEERRFPVLRYAALALAVVMLPLAAIATVAVGLRIDQYGFTPERLWALTFAGVAIAYGVAYWVAIVRGRRDWPAYLRPSNLHLAFILCVLALVLATPLVSFNAISTRDQVARLESGKIAPDKFDWQALAFEFGQPGRDALARLKTSANRAIRDKAVEVSKAENRWDVPRVERAAALADNLRVLPAGTALNEDLKTLIARNYSCNAANGKCTLVLIGNEALLLTDHCYAPPPPAVGEARSDSRAPAAVATVENGPYGCGVSGRFVLEHGKWRDARDAAAVVSGTAASAADYRAGRIEIRPVQRRQVFVGDTPVGEAFE